MKDVEGGSELGMLGLVGLLCRFLTMPILDAVDANRSPIPLAITLVSV
jgi:hypothetical protein